MVLRLIGLLLALVVLCAALAVLEYLHNLGSSAFVPTRRRLPAVRSSRDVSSQMGAMDVSFPKLDGAQCRVGIVTTRWNKAVVDALAGGVKKALKECGVTDGNVFETEVPGAFELPLAARFLALSGTVDAMVCVGCLVQGDTPHFNYIASAVSSGLMTVGLQTSTPVVFGVLTVNDEAQARERAGLGSRSGKGENSGLSWGRTAVEMALLRQAALGGGKTPIVGFGAPTPLAVKSGGGVAPGVRPAVPVKPGIGF